MKKVPRWPSGAHAFDFSAYRFQVTLEQPIEVGGDETHIMVERLRAAADQQRRGSLTSPRYWQGARGTPAAAR